MASAAGFDPTHWIPSWVRASAMAAEKEKTSPKGEKGETESIAEMGDTQVAKKKKKGKGHRLVKMNRKESHE